ncbi:MAG: HYR domain-containing protein [Sandaracinaceae bacterium]|nr:HYR domain-containing protein [Sandaracinaceae bacterium]
MSSADRRRAPASADRRHVLGVVLAAASLVTGCNCDGTMPPPSCGMDGTPADQPAIECPAEIDLGCIPASGTSFTISPGVATCDGSTPTITCDPPIGSNVTPDHAMGTCTARSASGASASCTFRITGRVDGMARLACADDVAVECSGVSSPAMLGAATPFASCSGGTIGTIGDDRPAEGFPLGTTSVTFSAMESSGARLSCTTDVIVSDTTAPAITCPASSRIVRTSETDPVTVAEVTATDRCDASPTITLAPPTPGHGTTRITATATDDAGLTASCSFDATVLDLFAPSGLRVVSATLTSAMATDTTIGWTPSAGADVTRTRVERASADTGPWTMVAELDPATITYTDRAMPGPVSYYRVVALGAGGEEGGASVPLRVFTIEASGYDLSGQSVPGVPFATSLWGTVRTPVALDRGPFPLVLFLHGNHGNCRPASGDDDCETREADACTDPAYTTTPNAAGYVYLQDTLAAQGYATASISANALNCRDDFIPERTALLVEHLRRWQRWATTDDAPFAGRFRGAIDLAHVGLVGHSRGGEAVSQAPQALAASPIPGLDVTGVLAIGPTDYHENIPQGVAYLVLLPACDADVNDLQGARMYDRGLRDTDTFARSQLLFVGTNHNFFNTEWRFDDNMGRLSVCPSSARISPAAQRAGLELLLSDWLASANAPSAPPAYVRTDAEPPAIFQAWSGTSLDLRFAYSAASRRTIDDFSRAGFVTNTLGSGNTFSGFTAALDCTGGCAGNYVGVRGAARLAWDGAPASASFGLGSFDASGDEAIAVRFASRAATINDGLTEQVFFLRVHDAAGTTAEVRVPDVGRIAHGYGAFRPLEVLTTVRVPTAELRRVAPTLDLAHLASFEVAMPAPEQPRGSIWIADVEAHHAP